MNLNISADYKISAGLTVLPVMFDISRFLTSAEVVQYLFSGESATVTLTAAQTANITKWIKSAHRAICGYLGYNFSYQTFYEYYSGNDTSFLYLKNRPVVKIHSALWLSVAQDIAHWTVQDNGIMIDRGYGYFDAGNSNYYITYDAGYTVTTLPGDIKQAGLELIALYMQSADRAGKQSESRNQYNVSYKTNPEREILDTLAQYRSFYND